MVALLVIHCSHNLTSIWYMKSFLDFLNAFSKREVLARASMRKPWLLVVAAAVGVAADVAVPAAAE